MALPILICEDDAAIRRGLEINLQSDRHETIAVGTGEEALAVLAERDVALVLLDVMLPGISGLDVCRTLRERGATMPIVLVSARGAEREVIQGLEIGADDYIVKPFRIGELRARVRVRLRRSPVSSSHCFGDVEVDLERRHVRRAGELVELTGTEFDLLRLFLSRAGDVLTRDTILDSVWGRDYTGTDRTVDNFINRLRSKLDEAGSQRFFATIRGVGYRFLEDE